jgi:hypothetical protein
VPLIYSIAKSLEFRPNDSDNLIISPSKIASIRIEILDKLNIIFVIGNVVNSDVVIEDLGQTININTDIKVMINLFKESI